MQQCVACTIGLVLFTLKPKSRLTKTSSRSSDCISLRVSEESAAHSELNTFNLAHYCVDKAGLASALVILLRLALVNVIKTMATHVTSSFFYEQSCNGEEQQIYAWNELILHRISFKFSAGERKVLLQTESQCEQQ